MSLIFQRAKCAFSGERIWYHSLIEEDKVEEVKNFEFVDDVYPYKTKLIARG